MKETVLDVLMYLVENYLEDEIEADSDQEKLRFALAEAGFPQEEIDKALQWLDSLASNEDSLSAKPECCSLNVRVFIDEELNRMDVECRGFLLFLEQSGVLDPNMRERVVDRVMALETDAIDLEQLKWVVLMVLFNQPGQENTYAWMEDLVLARDSGRLH